MKNTDKYKALREWTVLFSAVIISLFFIAFRDSSFNKSLSEAGLDAYSLLNYDYFSFREKRSLENEIAYLKMKLTETETEKLKFYEAYRENMRLRDLFSVDRPESLTYIYAKVTGRDPGSYGKHLLINSGTERGVEENDAVMSVGGVIGTVVTAGEKSSKVRLVTDPSLKIAVRTEKLRIPGILHASGRDIADIEEITKNSTVEEGELVYTSDFSTVFPPDLLIGEIISVSDSSATINKRIQVRFSADTELAEDVFVVKRAVHE